MPASQPTRSAEEETLRLSSNSLCSTTFTSRQQRRPVYATTTQDRRTSLWHIDPAGTLTEVAKISWVDGPNKKNGSSVSFPSHPSARVIKAEDFLARAKGLFSSGSRTFQYGELSCKWRTGDDYDSDLQPGHCPEAGYAAGVWHCRATPEHPQSSTSACPLIARFSSSRFGVAKSEVTLYSPWVSVPRFVYNNQHQADYPLDLASTLILSIILLVVHKDEWKDEKVCSQTPESLRAQLEEALLATELPSYTASRVGRDRSWVVIGDEPPRRRRHPRSTPSSPAEPSPATTTPAPAPASTPPPPRYRPTTSNINTTAYRSRCAPSPAEDTQPLLLYTRTASRPPSAPVQPTPQRRSRTMTVTPPRTADAAYRPRAFSAAQRDTRLPPPYSPPLIVTPTH